MTKNLLGSGPQNQFLNSMFYRIFWHVSRIQKIQPIWMRLKVEVKSAPQCVVRVVFFFAKIATKSSKISDSYRMDFQNNNNYNNFEFFFRVRVSLRKSSDKSKRCKIVMILQLPQHFERCKSPEKWW